MYAIEVLVAEHETVRRLNRIMRNACLHALESGQVNADDFYSFISIIREFADRHHHGKEEELLFKEMTARLGSAAEKLVQHGMLVEHDLGRLYVRQLEEAVNRYASTPERESLLDILTNAMAYADLLERHIERENTVVYAFAQRSLSPDVCALLDEQTRAFEQSPASVALLKKVSALLEQLETSGQV